MATIERRRWRWVLLLCAAGLASTAAGAGLLAPGCFGDTVVSGRLYTPLLGSAAEENGSFLELRPTPAKARRPARTAAHTTEAATPPDQSRDFGVADGQFESFLQAQGMAWHLQAPSRFLLTVHCAQHPLAVRAALPREKEWARDGKRGGSPQ
jgi:hypothetical protein